MFYQVSVLSVWGLLWAYFKFHEDNEYEKELIIYCILIQNDFNLSMQRRYRIIAYLINFFKINLFIYLFLAALGFHCCLQAFFSCGEWGLLFVVVRGLLIAVASLAAEHGLQARGLQQLSHVGSVVVAHGLQSAGSVVVVHGLSCSVAYGTFPDQGSNSCPLHWQADS